MRYLVVHSHLYQPPRENPWTEEIRRQPSAAPFHDWNARVSDECYERLGAAAARGADGQIRELVNLFGWTSFNIGPTLAGWLERERPEVMADARRGDATAAEISGIGSAMMQAYGHPILPLCCAREKRLQIAWGKADFVRRFGREPLGVWLPETGVDLETLEVCADYGLQYTILAPEQIAQVRRARTRRWLDVSGGRTPTHRPLYVKLPSGRRFTIFVFHGDVSRRVAFAGVLSSGERLLGEIRQALDRLPGEPAMLLVAADGETFGHHQKGAEESLAEALVRARLTGTATVSHLGHVFKQLKPGFECRLVEPSAWSCAHGVGRWSRACGCKMAEHGPDWNWEWREALRHAVQTLRDRVFVLIDRRGEELFRDPWAAFEAYGEALCHATPRERVAAIVAEHGADGLSEAQRRRASTLLELVRQVLFSATSCGWFFDDIAGIEATQVLRHAARASELTRQVFDVDPEPEFVDALSKARANEPGVGSGADAYMTRAATARHEPKLALAWHGLQRLKRVLIADVASGEVASSLGIFAVDELSPPDIERGDGDRVVVRGRGRVVHLRTGDTWSGSYEVISPDRTSPVEILLDGEPVGRDCGAILEAAVEISASRAVSRLPAPSPGVLADVAWLAREALDAGIPLPSPFLEAVSGGGRALLQDCLERAPLSSEVLGERLCEALEAIQSAGLSREDVEDLRPATSGRLALLAEWVLGRDRPELLAGLECALRLASEVMSDAVLVRARRVIVERIAPDAPPEALRIVRAAGLSVDALRRPDPAEKIARSQQEEQTLDDLA